MSLSVHRYCTTCAPPDDEALKQIHPSLTFLKEVDKRSGYRSKQMLVAPIILSTLVVGLAGAGEKHIGRLLLKALAWFWAATAVALCGDS